VIVCARVDGLKSPTTSTKVERCYEKVLQNTDRQIVRLGTDRK